MRLTNCKSGHELQAMDRIASTRLAGNWKEHFAALELFMAREGHCNVPRSHVEGTIALGRWVRAQRLSRDSMPVTSRKRLDELGFIWNLQERAWEEGYAAFVKYGMRQGHSCVPQRHHEDNFRLGQWVNLQRKKRDMLTPERKRRLDDVEFVWDSRDFQWEEMFCRLKRYTDEHGHCGVHRKRLDASLIRWVGRQRMRRATLSEEQRIRLDRLGFIWNPLDEAWQRGFSALKRFKAREGHCCVPEIHVEGTYNLGVWAKEQRRRKESMTTFRKIRLNAIGFWRQSIVRGAPLPQRHRSMQAPGTRV